MAPFASGTDILFLAADQDQFESDVWVPPRDRKGQLLEYTAKECRYRPLGETRETAVDVDRVAQLYQPLTRSEIRARKLFERRQYDQFVKQIPGITSARVVPDWRKQYTAMLAAYAQWDRGAYNSALEMVGEFDYQALTPISIAVMPIQWSGEWPGSNASEEAIKHLNHASPAVRIVAASWLLSTPHEGQAIHVLHQLSEAKSKNIAILAKAVLWRNASADAITDSTSEFLATLEQIPVAMRHAPSQLLADKFASAGLHAQAKKIRSRMSPIPHQVPLK